MEHESVWFEPPVGPAPSIEELDIVRVDLSDGSIPSQFLVVRAEPDPDDPGSRRLTLLADPDNTGPTAV